MKTFLSALVLVGSQFGAAPAHAVDGCKVLLCMAGNWKGISDCRSDVERALWDAGHGRGFPSCSMSGGSSNAANLNWASEATCPTMYSMYDLDSGRWSGCTYTGFISLTIDGVPWADVFFNLYAGGSTSTKYYDPARTALGAAVDNTYDADLAAWIAAHPPVAPDTGSSGL